MEIKSAAYLVSSANVKQCPAPDRPEYAFIGRSNVGKSSLINMLCNNARLAKTSSAPGKTQLINHFVIESADEKGKLSKWYLTDLPGYGFAKVSLNSRRRWEEMIYHFLRERENLKQVFVLIDSRHGPQKIDLAFLERLKKDGIAYTLIFTKTDKENQRTVSANVKSFLEALRKTNQFLPQHFLSSATKKSGRDKILQFIEESNISDER